MITLPRYKKQTGLFWLLAWFLCLFIFCTPPPHENTKPKLSDDQVPMQVVAPLPSFINVPIRMKTRVVEEMLNKQLPGLLYECDTLTLGMAKGVKIKVWKGDSIGITLEKDELRYRVTLRLWLQFSFTVGAFGVSHTEYQDVEAGLTLKFRSRVFVKND